MVTLINYTSDMISNFENEIKTAQTSELPESVRNLATTSAKIRELDRLGYTRSAIKKALGLKHYQHVRNVLLNPPKKTA